MELPNKKYNIIYADPAWHYQTWGEGGNRNVTSKYKTMTMKEIWDLPVNDIACLLYTSDAADE